MYTVSPFTRFAVVASSSMSSPLMLSAVNSPRIRKNPPVAFTRTDSPSIVGIFDVPPRSISTSSAVRPWSIRTEPLDLEGSARLDGFRVQVPRDADGTRRPELLDLHVTFETTSACDARHFCDEGSLNPGAPGRPELDRLHGVPAHDAAPDDLDRLVAQLRPCADAGKVHRAHRLADRTSRVARGAGRVRGSLSDRVSNRRGEIHVWEFGFAQFLGLLRFRLVTGFDL